MIEHNHPEEDAFLPHYDNYHNDCIRCRLEGCAEELFLTVEEAMTGMTTTLGEKKLQAIIKKIRGKK